MTSNLVQRPHPRIEAVFLDVGGVFHVPDHDMVTGVLEDVGVTVDRTRLDLAHFRGAAALDRWPSQLQGMWAAYQEAYAVAAGATPDQLAAAVVALNTMFATHPEVWCRVLPGSPEALRALHATGVKLAIVSNSDGTVEERLAENAICQVGEGPGVPVSIVVDSAVVGVAKPDPGIFRFALDAAGVAPEATLYVGDTVGADVVGARAAGLRPIHLDPYDLCSDPTHEDVSSLDEVIALVGERPRPGRVQ
jgi:putative hydrolase of the HAD superfamily